MQLLSRNYSTMGYKAKPEQFPQLINIQSAAVVLISVKATCSPLITKACEIKTRNSIKNTLHSCVAALPRQSNIDTEVLDAGSPTERQIRLTSWEQILKIIIIIIKIQYVGCWEDQIGNKKLGRNG